MFTLDKLYLDDLDATIINIPCDKKDVACVRTLLQPGLNCLESSATKRLAPELRQ